MLQLLKRLTLLLAVLFAKTGADIGRKNAKDAKGTHKKDPAHIVRTCPLRRRVAPFAFLRLKNCTLLLKTSFAFFLIAAVFLPVAHASDIDNLLRSMTLEEKIGQLLMPAFRVQDGKNVTELTPQVEQALRRYRAGGVILFRENLVTAEQTRRLINELQTMAGPVPLFIGIDQEGGRVTRLPYGTVMPGNMALGATGKPENACLAAKAIGEELVGLGFNLNFAPVLDINSNPDNPVIGVRSFGEEPDAVASMGKAYLHGLSAAGIAAAVKHFPGHGDTAVDSHIGLPVLPYGLKQLVQRELKPFRLTLSEAPAMIMTAHIALPEVERETVLSLKNNRPVYLPATLSRAILTGLLRESMKYDGIIITDALNMKAIVDHFGPGDSAVRAIQAGADILLMPELDTSFSALLAAVHRGDITEQRIDQSVRRILAVKQKYGLFNRKPPQEAAKAKVQRAALEASLAAQAVTLLKNENQVLPFTLWPNRKILLLAPKADQLAAMRQATEQIVNTAGLSAQDITGLLYQGEMTASHLTAIKAVDQIVLATETADAKGLDPDRSPAAKTAVTLAAHAVKTGKPLAVLALRNPYDIAYLQSTPAFIAVYAPVAPNITAGMRVIFGLAEPQGKLPVTIFDKAGNVLHPRGFGLAYK